MRRTPKNPVRKFSAESQRLASLAQSMVRASSRIEARGWEARLDALLQKQLANNQQQAIDNLRAQADAKRAEAQVEPLRKAFVGATAVTWDKPRGHFKQRPDSVSWSGVAGGTGSGGFAFDLMEDGRVRGVGCVVPVDLAGDDDAHRRRLLLHGADLHRRGVGAQQPGRLALLLG